MAVAIAATMTAGYYAYGQSVNDADVEILPTLRYDVEYGTIAHDLSLVTERVNFIPILHNAIGYNVTGNPWIAVFPDPLTTEEGGSLVASGDPIKPYDYSNDANPELAITCNTNDFGHDPTMLAEFDYIPGATYTGIDTFDIVIKEFTYTGNAGNATCTTTGATKTIPVEITVGEKPSVTFRDDFTKFSNSSGVVVLDRDDDLIGLQPPGDGFFDFAVPFPSFDLPVSNAIVGLDLPETTDDGSAITPVTLENGTKYYVIRGVFSNDSFSYNATASLPYGTVAANGTIVGSLNEIASKTIDVTLDASGATDVPICSADIISGDLDFGSLAYGDISDTKRIVSKNTGTTYAVMLISGTDWLDSHDTPIMDVGQTRYTDDLDFAYANILSISETDTVFTSFVIPDNERVLWLQVQIGGDISPDFTGQITQTVTISVFCP